MWSHTLLPHKEFAKKWLLMNLGVDLRTKLQIPMNYTLNNIRLRIYWNFCYWVNAKWNHKFMKFNLLLWCKFLINSDLKKYACQVSSPMPLKLEKFDQLKWQRISFVPCIVFMILHFKIWRFQKLALYTYGKIFDVKFTFVMVESHSRLIFLRKCRT